MPMPAEWGHDTLASHNVAHIFNACTRMPTLADQISIREPFTANFTVTRALLVKGRAYEGAVKTFEPYERVHEVNEEARKALVEIANEVLKEDKSSEAHVHVNNRLEGCAPGTIEAVAKNLLGGIDWTS